MRHLRDPADAAALGRDILEALASPWASQRGHEIQTGASVGIAVAPEHGTEAETLMGAADAALYRAKELGRGTFAYFTQELTPAAARRMELEARLRRAVREQRLALQAMGCDRYQGYWQGGRPTEAMEVLARWQQARAI